MTVSGDSVVLMAASFDLRNGLLIELLGDAFLGLEEAEETELASVEAQDAPESLILLLEADDDNSYIGRCSTRSPDDPASLET